MSSPKLKNVKRIILQNSQGNVIRSYRWDQPEMILIRRLDTGRIEAQADLKSLREEKSPFQIIIKVNIRNLGQAPVSLGSLGQLSLVRPQKNYSWQEGVVRPDEGTETQFFGWLRWSAIFHFAVVLLMIGGLWISEEYLAEEPTTIEIATPLKKIKKNKKTVVTASKAKINRKKKVNRRPKKIVKRKNSVKKDVQSLGALAALGGSRKGSRSHRGLKLNSSLNSVGSGSDLGARSKGRHQTVMPGQGVFAQSGGGGSRNLKSVGYGTKGRAGGQSGYGKTNIGGRFGDYEYPASDTGQVIGGLEKSQIRAVIDRNMGQIIYCYEKGLQKKSSLKGRVVSDFRINGKGRVFMSEISRSSMGSQLVENCIAQKIKKWQFPRPHGNVDVKVSFPFDLKRAYIR